MKLLTTLALVLLTGCATTKIPKQTTDGWAIVAERKGVEVHIFERSEPFQQHTRLVYDVRITNHTPKDICVKPVWRLMDLDNKTYTWTFLPAATSAYTGQLIQHVWYYDKTYMLLPPSGMVYDMKVIDAVVYPNGTYECVVNPAGVVK